MALHENMQEALIRQNKQRRKELEERNRFINEWVLSSPHLCREKAVEQAELLWKSFSLTGHSHAEPLGPHTRIGRFG